MLRVSACWFMRYRRTWRDMIVISVANPLLFLTGVGVGLGHLVDRHPAAQLAGVSYAAFFAPGLLAAAAMQTAFLESAFEVARAAAPAGAYQTTVPTPLSPAQVMTGHLLYVASRVLTSSAAFVLVMAGFGLVSAAHAAYLCALAAAGYAVARVTYRRRLHA